MPIVLGVLLAVVLAAAWAGGNALALTHLWWPAVPYLLPAGLLVGAVAGLLVFASSLVGVGVPAATVVGPDRTGDDDGAAPQREPTWPHYLAAQARIDLQRAFLRATLITNGGWRWAVGRVRAQPRLLVLGVFLLFPSTGLTAATAGAVASALGAFVTCAGVLVVIGAGWRLTGWVLGLVDLGVRRARGARASCPHSGCNWITDVPTFRCPCGAEHRAMGPGRFGTAVRRCACGGRLPTTVLRAGRTLAAVCPRCGRSLQPGAATVTDIRLPVLGPVSAGKTRFVHAGIAALTDLIESGGGTVRPADAASVAAVTAGRMMITSGSPTDKTPAGAPPAAISLHLDTGSRHALLHLFDAAGEFFADREQSRRLAYLDEAQGFVLVVDPFSVGQVQAQLTGALVHRLRDAAPAADDPESAYRTTVTWLRDTGVPVGRRALAVVVAKADLLLAVPPGADLSPVGTVVRNWLVRHDLDNLVLAAERDFREVGYFLVSSTAGLRSTDALTAVAPLAWLCRSARLEFPAATVRAP